MKHERPALRTLSPFGSATERFMRDTGRAFAHGRAARAVAALKARARWLDLTPEEVDLAAELLRFAPGLDAEAWEAGLHLALIALFRLGQGSTRTRVRGDQGDLAEALEALAGAESAPRIAERIEALLATGGLAPLVSTDPDAYAPLVLSGPDLYLQRVLKVEDRLAAAYVARAALPRVRSEEVVDEVVRAIAALPPRVGDRVLVPSEAQIAAVKHALARPLSVITGGPGTGKTTIAVSLLRALVRLGVPPDEIALAAPTGRAAQRLADSILSQLGALPFETEGERLLIAKPPEPKTLHRLLAYSPRRDRFLKDERDPLSERVVIVDETSMIDLFLAERLFAAIDPCAQLVLLGDADQLPSIEVGAVLRDICAAEGAGVVARLDRSFRASTDSVAGGTVLELASAIRRGSIPDERVLRRAARADELSLEGVEMLEVEGRAALPAFLERWFSAKVSSALTRARSHVLAFDGVAFGQSDAERLLEIESALEAAKILCVTRSAALATGAERVNGALHDLALLGPSGPHRELLPGEPVMMRRNDYERGVFNGDRGVVLLVALGADPPRPMVVFRTRTGFTPLAIEPLRRDLELSYALTVHKAQGSEFDAVALLLPDVRVPLLSREILYTAVSRSRRSVTIVGTRDILDHTVRARGARSTGLKEKLSKRSRRESVGP